MTLQHTPSPWIHDHSEIIDGRGLRVCRFADYGAPSPEDMSVILAAPDMLRLLRAILKNHRAADYENMIKALGAAAQFVERLDGEACPDK